MSNHTMRIDRATGVCSLSKTDTKRWHRSPQFQRDTVEILADLLCKVPRAPLSESVFVRNEQRGTDRRYRWSAPLQHVRTCERLNVG